VSDWIGNLDVVVRSCGVELGSSQEDNRIFFDTEIRQSDDEKLLTNGRVFDLDQALRA